MIAPWVSLYSRQLTVPNPGFGKRQEGRRRSPPMKVPQGHAPGQRLAIHGNAGLFCLPEDAIHLMRIGRRAFDRHIRSEGYAELFPAQCDLDAISSYNLAVGVAATGRGGTVDKRQIGHCLKSGCPAEATEFRHKLFHQVAHQWFVVADADIIMGNALILSWSANEHHTGTAPVVRKNDPEEHTQRKPRRRLRVAKIDSRILSRPIDHAGIEGLCRHGHTSIVLSAVGRDGDVRPNHEVLKLLLECQWLDANASYASRQHLHIVRIFV